MCVNQTQIPCWKHNLFERFVQIISWYFYIFITSVRKCFQWHTNHLNAFCKFFFTVNSIVSQNQNIENIEVKNDIKQSEKRRKLNIYLKRELYVCRFTNKWFVYQPETFFVAMESRFRIHYSMQRNSNSSGNNNNEFAKKFKWQCCTFYPWKIQLKRRTFFVAIVDMLHTTQSLSHEKKLLYHEHMTCCYSATGWFVYESSNINVNNSHWIELRFLWISYAT